MIISRLRNGLDGMQLGGGQATAIGRFSYLWSCASALTSHRLHSSSIGNTSSDRNSQGVVIAVGANQGDRYSNITAALELLPDYGINVKRHSRLFESAAAYVTEQPAFLNAAVTAETALTPHDLLRSLKSIEERIGRDFSAQRWGPRPIDLDIIFYGDTRLLSDQLTIPHPRWAERDFVKAPLADLAGDSGLSEGLEGVQHMLAAAGKTWEYERGEDEVGGEGLRAVVPLRAGRVWAWQGRTHVMGILNVTPDSFSDAGAFTEVDAAVQQAKQMVAEGADIIDIGGQSTRPGAQRLSPQEELQRVLHVVRRIAQDEAFRETLLSVDTFYAAVAREAVGAGAHIVNDVSGGSLDPDMHATVAQLGVPYVLMHMRGDPTTMQHREHTTYTDTCAEVGRELQQAAERAMAAGIESWRIILDPGLGFAKTKQGNLQLLDGLGAVRQQLRGTLRRMPLLVGASRKGFLGAITGNEATKNRDYASAAAAALAVRHGADIVRAHNVKAAHDAVRLADAVNAVA